VKDGQQVSLVAAGALPKSEVRAKVAELAASIGLDPKAQAALIAAKIPKIGA